MYDFGLSPRPCLFPRFRWPCQCSALRTWESLHKRRPSVIHYTCLMQGCFRSKNYELVPGQFIEIWRRLLNQPLLTQYTQWIGKVGENLNRKRMAFYQQIEGFPVNFPANQFYEIRGFSSCIEGIPINHPIWNDRFLLTILVTLILSL